LYECEFLGLVRAPGDFSEVENLAITNAKSIENPIWNCHGCPLDSLCLFTQVLFRQ